MMSLLYRHGTWWVWSVLLLGACSDDRVVASDGAIEHEDRGESQHCEQGRSLSCACFDGRNGAQVCDLNGVYGPCLCFNTQDSSLDSTADASIPVDAAFDLVTVDTRDVPTGTETGIEVAVDGEAPPDVTRPSSTLRPIAPISAGRVSVRRPTLRWVAPSEVQRTRVQLCADRPCARVLATMETTATSIRPESILPPGVVYWRLQGLGESGATVATSATWEFFVGRRDADHETSYGTTHDLDGDGYTDFASRSDNRAQLQIFWGGASGPSMVPIVLPDPGPATRLGLRMTMLDDDGDGRAALIASVDEEGLPLYPARIYRFVSSSSRDIATSFVATRGRHTYLCNAGDLDGDGYPDLVQQVDETSLVFRGGVSPSTVPREFTQPLAPLGVVSACAGADLDADGYSDLIVSGTYATAIIPGSPDGPAMERLRILSHVGSVPYNATATGLGDLNGDGVADLCVGLQGRIQCGLGRTNFSAITLGIVLLQPVGAGNVTGRTYGDSIAMAGDLNGDGLSELVAGASDAANPEPDRGASGRTYVYFGGTDGLASMRRTDLSDIAAGDLAAFGYDIAISGDVDGDGFDELLIGAPDSACSVSGCRALAGAVLVYRGGVGAPTFGWTWARFGLTPPSGTVEFGLGATVASCLLNNSRRIQG